MVMGKCIHVQTKHTDIVVEIDIDLFLASMWYLQTKKCVSLSLTDRSRAQAIPFRYYIFMHFYAVI